MTANQSARNEKNESNKCMKEAHAQRKKTEKYSENTIKKDTVDVNITQMMVGKQWVSGDTCTDET